MRDYRKTGIIIGIILVIVLILLKIFVFYDKYKLPKNVEIEYSKAKLNELSAYEKYSLLDDAKLTISNDKYKVKNESFDLDTTTIGEHTYTIKLKKGLKTYLHDVAYTVKDDEDPIFIKEPPATITFYVNEVDEDKLQELKDSIVYADNYDPEPKLSFKGEVDFNTVGEYNIVTTVTDSSSNVKSKTTTITIKERPVETEESKEEKVEEKENAEEDEDDGKLAFEDQILKYRGENTYVGIDVSKWQGEIDFNKVKEAGVEFVILRLGVMKDKDTPLAKDNTFDVNFKNAKKAGLKVGVYVYSEADTVEKAIENAKFVEENVKAQDLDFPVAFDWEFWKKFHTLKINIHRLQEMYEAFRGELTKNGYSTMLYSSQSYLKNNLWGDYTNYNVWVARYNENPPELPENEYEYIMWQNSCTGKVDGIAGDVDLDVFFFEKELK